VCVCVSLCVSACMFGEGRKKGCGELKGLVVGVLKGLVNV